MLPTGTVTFLFTDIEGSTRLWEADSESMQAAIARHDALVRGAVEAHGGYVFKTVGDAFCVAFSTAQQALLATIAVQRALFTESWEQPGTIRIRAALHTGVAQLRDSDYFGRSLNRVARLLDIGHGGQTLLSAATAELLRDHLPPGTSLRDLGERRLKDLERPEHVFQLDVEGLSDKFPELRSVERTPNNLPLQLTSFVGREEEVAGLRRRLSADRLVTLTGAGGSGKTRLAIQVAADVIDAYPDGAFFVDLAGLTEASFVPQAIAQAVGVREESGAQIMSTLIRQLQDKRMLVILDNCEHLVAACAEAAETLLRNAPTVTLIATSREALGVPGESLFRVPPLAVPAGDAGLTVVQYDSARLFAERATAVMPGFQVTEDNAAAIAEICRRLDGIPLAIELAAARTAILSPQEIARRLDDRFRLLTGGSRTALPRQQTLHALIAWSHDLLGPEEQILFRRLAVFAGGFTLEACEAVCTAETAAGRLEATDILDSLAGLVAKSLVLADEGATTRYRLLETIRAYAREELAASGEDGALGERHLDWYLNLCRGAEPELVGAHQREWFDRIAADHDNLRAAMAWGLDHAPRQMLEMAKSLYWFWQARGHATEGRAWLDAGLGRPEARAADKLRQDALLGAGSLAWLLGDDAAARRHLRESADIAAERGDRRARAIALAILGHSMVDAGDLAAARTVIEKSVAIAREAGDPFVLARSLGTFADLARHEGNDEETVRRADEAISVFERVGMDEGIAFNLYYGSAGLRRRDPNGAVARLLRAVELFDKLDLPHGLYIALLMLIDLVGPAAESTARVLGALDALHERTGFRVTSADRQISKRIRGAAVKALGPERFATLAAEGRTLPRSAIVSLARQPE
jgi:predicted ATPase/class 3 adenylate cyclase